MGWLIIDRIVKLLEMWLIGFCEIIGDVVTTDMNLLVKLLRVMTNQVIMNCNFNCLNHFSV